MHKITLRTNAIGSGTPEQQKNAAYGMLTSALPASTGVEFPTLATTKFLLTNQNTRG